jgi:hypothetical protein
MDFNAADAIAAQQISPNFDCTFAARKAFHEQP